MQTRSKERFHYAWVILFCSILMAIAGFGVAGNTVHNFVTPVVTEFNTSVSSFTMFTSVEAASMAILYMWAGKILTKRRIGLVMGTALIIQFVGIALMAFYQSIPMFYFSGVLLGIGAAFTRFTAIPTLLNMWFKEKVGFALGLTMSMGSVGAIVFNYISASLITAHGWRSAYLILAIIGGALSIPAVMFLVKSPEEKGVLPYGAEKESTAGEKSVRSNSNSEWGPSRSEAMRMPLFYLVWMTCICYSIGSCFVGYVANFATMELGLSIKFGSIATIVVTIGTIICSSVLGFLNDRFGVRAGLVWGAFFSVAGMGLMILSITNTSMLLPAAAVMGLGGAMYTVQAPLIARSTLGGKHYASIWAVMMTGNSLAGAASFGPMGLFFDKTGTYKGALILCMSMYALSVLLGWIAVEKGKRLKDTFVREERTPGRSTKSVGTMS